MRAADTPVLDCRRTVVPSCDATAAVSSVEPSSTTTHATGPARLGAHAGHGRRQVARLVEAGDHDGDAGALVHAGHVRWEVRCTAKAVRNRSRSSCANAADRRPRSRLAAHADASPIALR